MSTQKQDGPEGANHASSDPELAARRDRLNESLAQLRPEPEPEQSEKRSGVGAEMSRAMKLSSEFIAGVLVGGGLGWCFDYFAGTSPFGLIVLLLLGFAAGVLNVLRSERLVSDPFRDFPGSDRDQDETER